MNSRKSRKIIENSKNYVESKKIMKMTYCLTKINKTI